MPWDPDMEKLQLQITPEMKSHLREIAAKENRSLSQQVRQMLQEAIDKRGQRDLAQTDIEKGDRIAAGE